MSGFGISGQSKDAFNARPGAGTQYIYEGGQQQTEMHSAAGGFDYVMSAEGQQSILRAAVEAIVVAGGAAAIFGRPVFSQETLVTGLLAGAAVAAVDIWAPSYGSALRFWPVANN